MSSRIHRITAAIEKNGYTVNPKRDIREFGTGFGILGRRTVADPAHGDRGKYLLYTEGSDYEKGFLTGWLAEPLVRKMAVNYANNVVWAFLTKGLYHSSCFKRIAGTVIAGIVYIFSLRMKKHINYQYQLEMKGLRHGCRKANKWTRVNSWR
ncbi:MAG TPA: hypothetical protein ENN69_03435, partial [Spirochaetia bacterium]|nr:hypothetical protein [Spirochaetia bacterium]